MRQSLYVDCCQLRADYLFICCYLILQRPKLFWESMCILSSGNIKSLLVTRSLTFLQSIPMRWMFLQAPFLCQGNQGFHRQTNLMFFSIICIVSKIGKHRRKDSINRRSHTTLPCHISFSNRILWVFASSPRGARIVTSSIVKTWWRECCILLTNTNVQFTGCLFAECSRAGWWSATVQTLSYSNCNLQHYCKTNNIHSYLHYISAYN